ncbi:hypothetical protein [Marinagarivorans cellulosilyticus]|nr:hypothetical protein [Marinagarivorans cellulosilyticus]
MYRALLIILFSIPGYSLGCNDKLDDFDQALSELSIEVVYSKECNLVLVKGPENLAAQKKLDKLYLVLRGRTSGKQFEFSTYIEVSRSGRGEQAGGVCIDYDSAVQLDIEASYGASAGVVKCNLPSRIFKNIQELVKKS